ncbi:MAG: hypothetical protein HFJ06_01060 [Lachnospiraceae bacterium]|nr:hypothetical protein [Lachnospiraceae bacterium]
MKKIIICFVCVISIICSFVFGFYYCKEKVIRGEDSFIQKQIDRIAIVNLDEGIEIGNSRISYSGQLLKSVADYVYVGLNEAKAGLNADMYAAYIIIPADFSECIESINGVPQQAKVEYTINTGLTDRNRLEVEEKLSLFKEMLNTNTAYVYLSSVLSELHSAQDSASVILEHDQEDLNNIKNINPEEIFNMIEFSGINEVDNQIQNVDLSPYIKKNSTEVENIAAEINNGITEGKQKYQNVTKQYNQVSTDISTVQGILSSYNPLTDAEGNEVYRQALDNLDAAIDQYNEDLDMEGIEGASEIKEMIEDISNEYLNMELGKAQKTTDDKLEDIQKNNQKLIDEKISVWSKAQKEYYSNLNSELNKRSNVYASNMIENINNSLITFNQKYNSLINLIVPELEKLTEKNKVKEAITQCNVAINNLENSCGEIRPFEMNFNEYKYPDYENYIIILPQVEKLYEEEKEEESTEEDSGTDESLESTQNTDIPSEDEDETEKISIDIDENMEPEKDLSEFIQKKDEDIEGIVDSVKSNFQLSKSDISDIIDEELIGSIETENKKEVDDYKNVTTQLLNSMQEYDGKVTAFNPYDYIKQTEIVKHQTALTKNILALGNAMNEKNEEYLEFVNKVHQTANENVNTLQNDMLKANNSSKKELNTVITKLKEEKDRICQEDNEILGVFAKKMEYSRMGSLQYTDMYKFMVHPIGVIDQSEAGEIQNSDNTEKLKLDYKWIILISILVLLLFAGISLLIRVIHDRKELKAFEREGYE